MKAKKLGFRRCGWMFGRAAVLLITAVLWATPVAADSPSEPVYNKDFGDCVTGDNQFYNSGIEKFRWYVNQGGCDAYQNDQYERPTSQTFVYGVISKKPTYSPPPTPSSPTFLSGLLADSEFAVGDTVYSTDSGIYHEYVDITRARAGYDQNFMYFRIELFGDYEVDSAASRVEKFGEGTYYTVRLGNVDAPTNTRANGGIALRNQWESSQPSSWDSDPSSVKIFVDTNGDVSGAGGVNVTKDDGDSPGDGYDLDRANSGYLFVRKVTTSFTGPGGTVSRPAVEFAFNYVAYNADFGTNFTPDSITYLEFDATRGLKDNQNYLWNDEYTLNEAGSPNPASGGPNPGNLGEAGTSGTQNIYELDTLRGDGFGEPSLRAEKTAAGSYDRTIDWTLDKSVDVASHTGFAGAVAGSSTWTVAADKTEALGNFQVTGSITVYNDNEFDVPVTVSDVLSDGTVASVDCPSDTVPAAVLNGELTPGQLTCTYQASPADGSAELNTAMITSGDPEVEGATATAAIGWSEGNTYGYDSGTLSDDNPNNPNGPTLISGDTTWNYNQEFTCPTDLDSYDDSGKYSFNVPNTATLNGNLNLSDTESVTVDCYIPLISKTANGSYDETHTWDVEKSVDPESQSGFAGDTLDWTWTVNVSETSADSNFLVRGVITLSNPNPDDVMEVVLRDTANGNPPSTIAATPNPATNCNITSANGATWTLGPGETGTCNYVSSVTWQDRADVPTQNEVRAFLNWGTPELVGVSYVATPIEWTANVINGTAVVDDDQEPDLPQTLTAGAGPWEWAETQSENCSSDPADYGADGTYGDTEYNTATVTGSNGQTDSSDAQTTYDCYAPIVSKDASASYDERHTWDVEKSVDPASQSGDPGDTLQWTWTVDVSESSVDENFSVTGSISVANPAGSPGNMTVSLVDQLDDGTYATVDCGGEATIVGVAPSVEVAPGATATCSYSASPPDDEATLNAATGTFNGIDFTATADVNFVKSVVNGTANIDDDQEPDFPLTLTAGEGPRSWTETQDHTCSTDIADYEADGTYSDTRYNTATVTGSAGQTDSSDAQTTYTCEAGTLDVLKYTDGVVDDTYAWSFALYIGPEGFGGTQVGNTSSTLNYGDGVLDFGDPIPALRPDTTYTVCELSIAAGWATEWSIGGVTVIPYNPDAGNLLPEDLGNRCFDVGFGTSYPLTTGRNLRITVDNTFPGGDPRTPGYWKNWSSCSDGGQYDRTTDDVDPDNEYVSLDEVLNYPGVRWCDFTIDSCEQAVSILDQRDIASGKKMSSDSAYTLAMHLLAAELNFGAGAESCELASDAILYARNLLCQLDFVGTGSYLRPKGRTYEDYYYALDLKDLLDDYNNGRLCGEEIATDFPPHVSIDEPAEGDVIGDGGDNPVASIIVDASTSDDHGVIQVEFFVDGVFIGADLDDSDSFWSTAWDLSGVADGIHSITATATDTIGQTGSDSIELTVDNKTGDPMHVGDLDAATVAGKGGKWDATVTVEVHAEPHDLLIGATVDGTWSDGTAGSCTTDGSGQCTVTRSNGRKVSTVTFTVDSVSAAGYDYAAGDNHDPDGDSDGTSIVIGTP